MQFKRKKHNWFYLRTEAISSSLQQFFNTSLPYKGATAINHSNVMTIAFADIKANHTDLTEFHK